jgi:hypothetical protein
MASVVRMGICLILIAVCGIVGADDTKPDMSQWSSAVVTENGQLAVEGIQLVNQKGDPVVLRGVSFGWSNWWSQFYNEGAVNWLVNDWHCTVILASMAVGPQGSYLDRPEWSKKLITTVVDSAIKNDVYVIIDWHDHHAHQRTDEAVAFIGLPMCLLSQSSIRSKRLCTLCWNYDFHSAFQKKPAPKGTGRSQSDLKLNGQLTIWFVLITLRREPKQQLRPQLLL